MPTNVTPEYRKAEQAFRLARDPKERLACLKEMLRTIPKHKGSERLQADIKSRIKELTDELAGPKKAGNRVGTLYVVRPEGAAQVALIGPPSSGKSWLHQRLTGSHTEVGPVLLVGVRQQQPQHRSGPKCCSTGLMPRHRWVNAGAAWHRLSSANWMNCNVAFPE